MLSLNHTVKSQFVLLEHTRMAVYLINLGLRITQNWTVKVEASAYGSPCEVSKLSSFKMCVHVYARACVWGDMCVCA